MDEVAFLRGLEANPWDDTLRLVYADWLEERGDNRAEFLRAAVTYCNAEISDERIPELLSRLRESKSTVSAEWLVQVCRSLAEDDVREAVFREILGESGKGSDSFLAVDDGGDPSPYLMARLLERYSGILPASISEMRDGGVFNTKTGEQGGSVSVGGVEWLSGDLCTVSGGSYFGALASRSATYNVGLRNGDWAVFEIWNEMIS